MRLRLWCHVCMLWRVSQLTAKADRHTINPFGFNQNEGKTKKTEIRSTRKPIMVTRKPIMAHGNHRNHGNRLGSSPSIFLLPSSFFHLPSPIIHCFLCFSFLVLKPQAVFCSCSGEGKFTWIRCYMNRKRMGEAQQHQKWVYSVFVMTKLLQNDVYVS